MKEYIEREAAINACYDGFADCRDDCADNIRNLPAADVRPVVRGKWIDEPIYKQTLDGKTYDGYTYCSNCKADYPFGHKAYFCEVCGADMREVEHEEQI